jgi:hypothetical protein
MERSGLSTCKVTDDVLPKFCIDDSHQTLYSSTDNQRVGKMTPYKLASQNKSETK